MILVNGKIVLVDAKETITEAIAVRGGRILKVGSSQEIEELAMSSAKVIDLEGRTVLPGFVDSHEHVMRRGLMLDWVNCAQAAERLRQAVAKDLATTAGERRTCRDVTAGVIAALH